MRFQGRITDWRDEKGFGFITPNGGGDRIFVHIKALSRPSRRPILNDRVNYTLQKDEKGRPRAANVEFVSKRKSSTKRPKAGSTKIAIAAAFLALVAALVFAGSIPLVVAATYFAMSIVTYGAYAIDKAAARADRWRTQESTLHVFGLIGGWPGGLVAQQVLRHKSKKGSFLFAFWISVVANVACLLWLMSSAGEAFLSGFNGG